MQTCAGHVFPRMVTLEDIADKVGVSHSTVSRALADSPLVNRETKERIRLAAEEAGYRVNQIARNLKTRSTRNIGLIVPEVSNPYFPRLIQCVADRLRAKGYSLQLHLSGSDQGAEESSLRSLFENRADGVLLVTGDSGLQSRDQIRSYTAAGLPIVQMGWVPDSPDVDIVTGDDAAGGYALAQHLVQLGHRKVAILGKSPHRGKYDRIAGFLRGLAESPLEIDARQIVVAEDIEEIRRAVSDLVDNENPPTAIFAYQDSIALKVYRALGELGVEIPTEMSVVGFDDLEVASVVCPGLTTVGNHNQPLAERFVELLLEKLQPNYEARSPELVVISPELIVRGSTTPPRPSQKITRKYHQCC